METRFNANANRYVNAATGRFIAFAMEAKIQLRLERIQKAVQRAKAGSITAAAYVVATIAKGKIKTSQEKSQPGDPPATRRGLLRRAIRYAATQDKDLAVIGPAFPVVGTAGRAHEFGGRYKGSQYPERPFMRPALEESLDQFAGAFRGSFGR